MGSHDADGHQQKASPATGEYKAWQVTSDCCRRFSHISTVRQMPVLPHPREAYCVEPLGFLTVFFPPLTYTSHIMGRGCTHGVIRIIRRIAEFLTRVFRHAGDVECKDFQCTHHCRHTIRNHTQILGTGKHVSGINHRGELPHSLTIPEIIMAMIVEIVIKAVETPAFVIVKRTVCVGILCRNAWMEFPFLIWVLDKQHLVYKPKKGITQTFVLFILRLCGK